MSFGVLRQKIKSMDFGVLDVSKSIRVNRRVVYLKDVLALLDEQEKQLREQFKTYSSNRHQYAKKNDAYMCGFFDGLTKKNEEILGVKSENKE